MRSLLLICSCLLLALAFCAGLCDTSQAQTKGVWVEYQLPYDLPQNWSRMVGENVLVFNNRDDSLIAAFDVLSGAWHTYYAATSLEWSSTVETGRNVALVYNLEMVVAYSALTETFVPLTYAGALLNTHPYGVGCIADMGYFVTDQNFYVFDGEDAVWRSQDISDIGSVISYGVYGHEDYIYLYVNKSDDSKKIVAFSYLTKTFVVYDGDGYVEHRDLEKGFVFFKNTTPAADSVNHFFAGYAASLGTYELIIKPNNWAVWNSMDSRGHNVNTAMFFKNQRVVDNNWRQYLYGFDARHGSFVETNYDYTYTCSDNCPDGASAGANFAVATQRNAFNGQITHYLFDGVTNTYLSFFTPLIYPTCGLNAIPNPGGVIYSGADCATLWFYDTENDLGTQAALPPTVGGFSNPVTQRNHSTWGVADCQRVYDSTVFVYSYNQTGNNITSFEVESSLSYARMDSTNVGGLYVRNTGGPYQLLMYSPGTDSWTTVDFGASESNIGRGVQRDYIYWVDYNISGPMNIFDGVTGQEITLPFGWAYSSTGNTHKHHRNNFMLVHSSDDSYYGYSTHTRTYSEYESEWLGSTPNGQEDVVVIQKLIPGGGADILTYNVLYDCFVMESFDVDYGTTFNTWVGGKTALIMTLGGALLAFDPHVDVSTDVVDDTDKPALPDRVYLGQNYPNPFNPSTIIEYSLPVRSDVTVTVYNLLGQKVRTIVDANLPAGVHTASWDGTDYAGREVSSGVYFYRINTDGYAQSRKMLMLK